MKTLTGIILGISMTTMYAEQPTVTENKLTAIQYYSKKDYKNAIKFFRKSFENNKEDDKFVTLYLTALLHQKRYIEFAETAKYKFNNKKYESILLNLLIGKKIDINDYKRISKQK